ncbi:substrate-binding periplasmic protein [Endozoicomonas ascidiicola]|uniref:substrate-binding periplasmic protein n=1 Tax=Endozoicomonas ascidiicola TaxID=1698521 RepID=UPI000833A960|nr:transporter substrate-binding domain-containing protein [Endozoicomonas ascidiicola]
MKWFSLFLGLFCFSAFASASETISPDAEAAKIKRKSLNFAAPVWAGYTYNNGTGLYWDLLKEVYEPLGFTLNFKSLPWNRSMKLMTEYRTVDGVPGEGLDSDYEHLVFSKYPLEPEYLALVYSPGVVASFERYPSLSGKVVGMRAGYNLVPEGERYGEFQLKEFTSLQKGMQLLKAGAIDVLVDEFSEIDTIAGENNISLDQFEVTEFETGDYYYMSFNDSPANKPLVTIFDARMETLAKEGVLEELYAHWMVDMPEPLVALSGNSK